MKKTILTLIILVAISLGSKAQENKIESTGNVGIGTTNPKAVLDVGKFIPDGTLGSVFGRLEEGDNAGEGTYIGVKGFKTQGSDVNNIKSFALVHSFYGRTNSSINFNRGGSYTGGFMTFNTDNDDEKMRILPNGNVGIGTKNPTQTLDVNGSMNSNDYRSNNTVYITSDGDNTGSNPIIFRHFRGERMRINSDGHVGIGTENPGVWRLSVNGKIRAKEIKVETGWSDFVFYEDYKLPTLEEVENHIQQKGHLKDIPSAKEVEENGIFLGEMDSKLLQKIEELTLYTIQQQKEIQNLKEENKELKTLAGRLAKVEELLENKK